MMTLTLEAIDRRMRYGETVTITRDELNDIEATLQAQESDFESAQKEIDELLARKKQRDMAREIIEGLVECIDDDGNVTPDDKSLLARRIKAAVQFVYNMED